MKKMKLIIEVDQKYYEACKDAVEESYPSQIEEVIANGIPYNPSGDLISREALKEAISYHCEYLHDNTMDLEDILDLINHVSTVPLPDFKAGYKQAIIDGKTNFTRPQGEWINPSENLEFSNREFFYDCSICGNTQMDETNFCPNCGADMRGGAKNECDCK